MRDRYCDSEESDVHALEGRGDGPGCDEKQRGPQRRLDERALRRAQQQAREIAARTGTPLVIYRDGKVEKRFVDSETASDPEQNPRTAEADQ